ncbi:hypothetical protein ACFL6P_06290 [Candidatus Latescibacterota bacterium]
MGKLNIIILFFITIFALKNAYVLFIKKPRENLAKLGRSINTMLFWGAIIFILGFLGALLGFQGIVDSVRNSYKTRAGDVIVQKDGLVVVVDPRENINIVPKQEPIPQEKIALSDTVHVKAGTIYGKEAVVLGGIQMLLKLIIFSMTSFIIVSIVWYIFTSRHRKLLERAMKEAYTEAQ